MLPEEYTGSSPSSTLCLVLQWIPRSRRLFGTKSTQFLREGGACAVRTWKPGLSTHPWYLAPTCSVPVAPEEHRKIGVSGSTFCIWQSVRYSAQWMHVLLVYGAFWKISHFLRFQCNAGCDSGYGFYVICG